MRESEAYRSQLRRRVAAGDPFSITVLAGNEVFIDRVELRESLRAVHDGPLVDGKVPLELWLRNAVEETLDPEQRGVLQEGHDKVAAHASGEPEVPAEQLTDIPEDHRSTRTTPSPTRWDGWAPRRAPPSCARRRRATRQRTSVR